MGLFPATFDNGETTIEGCTFVIRRLLAFRRTKWCKSTTFNAEQSIDG